MTEAVAWLEARSAGAPPALRQRVRDHLASAPQGDDVATRLAEAGGIALRAALAQGRSRAAALDLLAADALVTLALQAQAESNPGELAAFARRLWRAGSPA